jgi:hypothetical protein
MNRWRWAALIVFLVGLAASFLLVPYSQGSCPDRVKAVCDETGSGLRMMAVLLTLFVTFTLIVIGALANPEER